jgi:outer membrane murein-binding lipoprotein Lpp
VKKFILVVLLVAGGAYYSYPMWKGFVPQKVLSKVDEFTSKVDGIASKIDEIASKVIKKEPKQEKKSNFTIVGSKGSSGSTAVGRAFRNKTSNIIHNVIGVTS